MRRAVVIAMAAALIALSLLGIVACNKHKQPAADDSVTRQESVQRVRGSLISALGEGWEADLSDDRIAELDDAGDYIVAAGFADMLADVLDRSSLLTGKLKVLADALESEDGKALLDDFDNNLERIVPVFDMVDFTRDDVSELFYLLLTTLVSDSGKTMDGIIARIQTVRVRSGIGAKAQASLDGALNSVNQAKANLVPTGAAKGQLLGALEDAKASIISLISFVYNMSDTAFTNEMMENMLSGDGALSDITDEELATIVNALSQNLLDLKAALSDSEIQKLDRAVSLLIANFDKEGITPTALYSQLYAQVVQYAKYANMVVGIIPPLCDLAYSASDLFKQVEFVRQFRDVVATFDESSDDQSLAIVNMSIISSKIAQKLMDGFGREGYVDLIDRVRAQGNSDYQKGLPALLVDVLLNLSVNLGKEEDFIVLPAHPNVFEDSDVEKVVGLIGFHLNIGRFKQRYYEYRNSDAAGKSMALYNLRQAAQVCHFEDLGAKNPYPLDLQNDEVMVGNWYTYYAGTGISKVKETSRAINEKVCDDLIAFVDEYYAEGSARRKAISELASMDLLTSRPSNEEQTEYMQVITDGGVGGFIMLLSVLFQLIA